MVLSSNADTVAPFQLSDIDRRQLASTDESFHPHTWGELKVIIAENRLETLTRWPSDLRRYAKWSAETKTAFGTIQKYIMEERLRWHPLPSSPPQSGPMFAVMNSTPLQDHNDFKIMPNDWPYGLEKGITHLIVWIKHRLEVQPPKGDMTPRARWLVEEFVRRTFVDRVQDLAAAQEKVLWFKNWVALQSVPALEHIHVLVRDIPEEVILGWTAGERIEQSWNRA